jgi:hypothetical protein
MHSGSKVPTDIEIKPHETLQPDIDMDIEIRQVLTDTIGNKQENA